MFDKFLRMVHRYTNLRGSGCTAFAGLCLHGVCRHEGRHRMAKPTKKANHPC